MTLIGEFAFDSQNRILVNSDSTIKLRKKEFYILKMLLDNPGVLITRQAIIDEIWQGNCELGIKGVRQVIWKLRSYFGDDSKKQRYIETVPNIGYRFVFPLSCQNDDVKPLNFWQKFKRYFVASSNVLTNNVPTSMIDSSSSSVDVSIFSERLNT